MIGTQHLPWTASCRRWRRRHLGKAQLQTDVSWGSPCSKMTMYCTTSEHTSCLDHCSQPKSVSLWRTEHTLFFTAVLMLPWFFCTEFEGRPETKKFRRGLCVSVGVEAVIERREGRLRWEGRVRLACPCTWSVAQQRRQAPCGRHTTKGSDRYPPVALASQSLSALLARLYRASTSPRLPAMASF